MPRLVRSIAVAVLAALAAIPARAQRPDTTRAPARPDTARVLAPRDTAARPAPATAARRTRAPGDTLRAPISPRRAFLYSLVVPGSAQSILGRHKTAALILAFEAAALSMVRESGADVHEARRLGRDSLIAEFTNPTTGAVRVPGPLTPRGTNGDYIRSRRSHLEDWVAVLIANHLFAGADAYVAANLWDLPGQLSMQTLPNGRTAITASFKVR